MTRQYHPIQTSADKVHYDEHLPLLSTAIYSTNTATTSNNNNNNNNNTSPVIRNQAQPPPRQPYEFMRSCRKLSLVTSMLLCIVGFVVCLSMDSQLFQDFQELGFSPSLFAGHLVAYKVGAKQLNKEDYVDGKRDADLVLSSTHISKHSNVQEGCEATVMLIRHCEKGSLKSHCNYVGLERAAFLASKFGDHWPAPSHIYAENPGHRENPRKQNYREMETVSAVAEKFNLPVNATYTVRSSNKLTKHLLLEINRGNLCGKVVLISWKHSDIGHLARHLGCGPMEGCPLDYKGRDFDAVWQIKFAYRRFPHNKGHIPKRPWWKVFGSVQAEGFDPLAYSHAVGDYPEGGIDKGGKWSKELPIEYTKQYLD